MHVYLEKMFVCCVEKLVWESRGQGLVKYGEGMQYRN